MQQEVYFNFGEPLKSRKLNEVNGLLNAVGPLCGFGSAKVEGNLLRVYPYGLGDNNSGSNDTYDPLRFKIRDRILGRNTSGIEQISTQHALITRDGTLFKIPLTEFTVEIINQRGINQNTEILLFAIHEPVSEAVDNPVTFKAYYSNLNNSPFYRLYKTAQDPYYGIKGGEDSLKGKLTTLDQRDPLLSKNTSFTYLENQAKLAVKDFADNYQNWVLIGVYGTGVYTGEDGSQSEEFSIVPYQSQGIFETNYSLGIHNFLVKAINRTESFLYENFPEGNNFTTLSEYLDYYLKATFKGLIHDIRILKDQINEATIPVGAIMLWDSDTPPNGWEEYKPAKGRVVVGYQDGGIRIEGLVHMTSVGQIFNDPGNEGDWEIRIDKELFNHTHIFDRGSETHHTGARTNSTFTCGNDGQGETQNGVYIHPEDFRKRILPPAITLMYIRKKDVVAEEAATFFVDELENENT